MHFLGRHDPETEEPLLSTSNGHLAQPWSLMFGYTWLLMYGQHIIGGKCKYILSYRKGTIYILCR